MHTYIEYMYTQHKNSISNWMYRVTRETFKLQYMHT